MLPSHHRYPYSHIEDRADYSWPDGKRLAFYIATNLECFAFSAGGDNAPTGGLSSRNYAGRDYGLRVGLAYLMEMFDQLGIQAGHNVNSLLYQHNARIFDCIRARGDEIIGHGRSNSERQGQMSEDEEARMIREVTEIIARNEGKPPTGWLGPGRSESATTPDLLKEAGYRYLMDWPCDDQPIWMSTRAGRILLVPYPLEVNDGQIIERREHSGREFADIIVDHFEEMLDRSLKRPLVCGIALHPFLTGHAFRLRPLRNALLHCLGHAHRERVWCTVPGKIADHCYALAEGIIPAAN